jgi:sulfate permease, SulP family
VLGAILMVMAVRMIDVWSLELLRKKSARGDSMVLWLVTGITVVVDLITAVGVGLVVAAFLYVRNQKALGATVEVSDLRHRRSRVLRRKDHEEYLDVKGSEVPVVGIRGSLFFGSADDHMGRLEDIAQGVKLMVIDVDGLISLDLTGARMLLDLTQRLETHNTRIVMGGLSPKHPQYNFLADLDEKNFLQSGSLYSTPDEALEAAETWFLQTAGLKNSAVSVNESYFWPLLTPTEVEPVLNILETLEFAGGSQIFNAGDPSLNLYFILEGRVEVCDPAGNRLAAYDPGQHLGLMSWMDQRPKTYTAIATTHVRLAVLARSPLRLILDQNPALGIKLIRGWTRQLTARLRRLQCDQYQRGFEEIQEPQA